MRSFLELTIPRPWVCGFLILLAVCFFASLAGSLLGVDYLAQDLPSLEALQSIEPSVKTIIFSAAGDTLREYYTENRTIVPLNRIPRSLQEAVISIEDRRFRQHYGLDLRRLGGGDALSTLPQAKPHGLDFQAYRALQALELRRRGPQLGLGLPDSGLG